jgi:hypothetical protein
MPFYTREELLAALQAIEGMRARRDGVCHESRCDSNGRSARPLQVARGRIADVAYGEHGTDYLAVDPRSGEVRCGACHGDADATVKEGGAA